MKRLSYFELDLRRCGNTYGTSPCTAGLDSPGEEKCFNSFASCQDRANFRPGYPLVESVTETEFGSDTTSHAVAMPTTVAAGDLLIVLFASDGDATVTTPSGWTLKVSQASGTAVRGSLYVKLAAGTEGGTTVDFVTSAAEAAAAQVFRILANNWGGNIADHVLFESADAGSVEAPNPEAIEPGWGSLPSLWIAAIVSAATAASVEEYPDGFGNGNSAIGGSGASGAFVASAYMNARAETIDPGPFDLNTAASTITFTIAVRPFHDVKLRFSTDPAYLPKSIDSNPCILSIDHSPAVISLGEDLGERASLKITCKDHRHSDAGPGYDPYRAERSYNAYDRGTHFGKVRARYPSLQGSSCRLLRGLLGDTIASMSPRHFVVESTEGPSADAQYSITAKDYLKLLDGDRAQAPYPSTARLDNAETSGSTSFELTPAGIGDEEFPSGSFYVCVGGKEVVLCTSRSSDTLTVTRAQLGTTAIAHDADERVQLVLSYSGEDVADIIYDLLVDYAGIPPNYIPLNSWRTETGTYLNQVYTAHICEPAAVRQLVSELIEQAGLSVWQTDSVEPLINLQVLRPIASSAETIDENLFVEGSLEIMEQPDKRASQVWTFFGQRDVTRPLDEESNYSYLVVTVDSDMEAEYGTPAIKKIYSRWIAAGGLTVAQRLNEILLSRFGRPPRQFKFKVFEGTDVSPGVGYRISATPLQDFTGAPAEIPGQVVSAKSEDDGVVVTLEELDISAGLGLADDVITIGVDENNVNLRQKHDEIYPEAESGDNVICYINSGVIVGSSDQSSPAFEVGEFPAGVNLYLVIAGRIQGKGGHGGNGGGVNDNGQDGQQGGLAFYTRRAINVDASLGSIWGGGGGAGGGGGGASGGGFAANQVGRGGGGGGGCGRKVGERGTAGTGSGRGGTDGDSGGLTFGGNGGDGGNGADGANDGGDGGNGGGPAQSGSNGQDGEGNSGSGGSGGGAGGATDGNSFITYGVWDGATFTPGATGSEDIRGTETG